MKITIDKADEAVENFKHEPSDHIMPAGMDHKMQYQKLLGINLNDT